MMNTCRFCGVELLANSSVCTGCDRFQDYRRFLSFGNASLSLVVAALSVATVLWTAINPFLFVAEEVALFGSFPDLQVANLGDRPILVTGAFIINADGLKVVGRLSGTSHVVKPGEAGQFELHKIRADDGPVVVRNFEVVSGEKVVGDCVAALSYVSNRRTTEQAYNCTVELAR